MNSTNKTCSDRESRDGRLATSERRGAMELKI